VDATSDIGKIYKQLEQHAQELGLDQEVELSLTKEGLIMRLSDHAVFDVGEALISPSALPLFNKIGAILRRTSYAVRIEGHTDNLPIKTAQYPSNWELSTARAVNVLRHFIETQDIPPQRLSAVGFGEYRPLASNDSPQQRAKNRRVEIIFLHKKAGRLGVSQRN
jgi:chemotaxis protein MotB